MAEEFQPVQCFFDHHGVKLSYFEWGTPATDKPSLLFVHATGFHGRCWDEIIERFAHCHVVSWEQQGHGRSEGGPIDSWADIAAQLSAFIESRDYRFALAIGHSMGGHVLTVTAAQTNAFDQILLIDPTIFNPEAYQHDAEYRAAFKAGSAPSERRRAEFPSVEAMKEGLAAKGSFPVYTPRAYDDYCRYGLLEQDDGSFRLACEPKVEASVYVSSRSNASIYESVRSVQVPVHIMRAQACDARQGGSVDFAFSPTWSGLVNEFPNATEHHYQELTHFIPMQAPDEVERVIRERL